MPIAHFADTVDNYTNVAEDDPIRQTKQYAFSPISLVANAAHCPPIRLYTTDLDTVPHQQAEEMRDVLETYFPTADIQEYTMSGNLHCFNYWHTLNDKSVPNECVSKQVIDFLDAHKNDP